MCVLNGLSKPFVGVALFALAVAATSQPLVFAEEAVPAELRQMEAGHAMMPDFDDQVYLAWVDGPPQLQAFLPEDKHLAGFREAHASLGIRSGHWGMVIDPRKLAVPYITFTKSENPVHELVDYNALQQAWASAKLSLSVDYRDVIYRPEAGPIPSPQENYKYSPIHIIESGIWFQHLAIYDLVLKDSAGAVLDAESWIELRAWGDQLLIEWFVLSKERGFTKLTMGLESEACDLSRTVRSMANSVQLRISAEGGSSSRVPDQSGVQISATGRNSYANDEPVALYSTVEDAWEVQIPKQDWSTESEAAYPEEYLDRVSSFDLELINTSDEPKELRLRMIHDYHPLTGYVPMFLDSDGKQTGLPIQSSKNWHVMENEPYPYEGSWINQTTRLKLEPKSQLTLRYEVVHALWQGLPASSLAQLSLIGWGFNGFWIQMALGAWGESVCIQPGRTMRRAYITDIRPFMVRSMYDMLYDWTSNMGGADILKVVDANGRYIPWVGAVTNYKMAGPNLSHVEVHERSADDRLRVQIDTYLPISDSINRSYFKVRMDVLEDVELSHLALFQFGSDYYNDASSAKVAWGSGPLLQRELEPAVSGHALIGDPEFLEGDHPWLCLFQNTTAQKNTGKGVRGLVVRDFDARIGDRHFDAPWVQANCVRGSLGAELQLPPDVHFLQAGDSIEFTLEFIILPINAESYFGPDTDLKERLEQAPDHWKLVAYEAEHQAITINGESAAYPLSLEATEILGKDLVVESSGAMATLTLTGLDDAGDSWALSEAVDGQWVPMGQRYPNEAGAQLNFDTSTRSWDAVIPLKFSEDGVPRKIRLSANSQ